MSDQENQTGSHSTSPKYRIGAVSRLTGLSADVVRVWERRYGIICPQRSEGGSRLYSDADVDRLRKLRQAVELGYAIGQVANLPESELKSISAGGASSFPVNEIPADPYALTQRRFIEAIERLDVVAADEELYRAATLYPPRSLVKYLVAPLLTEIGEKWAHREFGVAHEHIATNLIRNLLSSLFHLYPPDENAETIVLATPAGERHEFGILIGALMAATRGWRVIYLGADLPAEDIIRTVKMVKAKALVLSLLTFQTDYPERELELIAAGMPSYTRVWIGGSEDIDRIKIVDRLDWGLVRDFENLDDRLRR